jgi:hypothetical protein
VARNTLQSILNFCGTAEGGRAVLEVFGDSTAERNGNGWSYGFQAGFGAIVPCAGILVPPNHNSGSSETHGYFQTRRVNNGASVANALGVTDPADYTAQGGYPTSYKQYGIQVPLRDGWQGPQAAFLGHTTLAADITAASPADAGNLTLTDASPFASAANKRVLLYNGTTVECIMYQSTNTGTNNLVNIDRANNLSVLLTPSGALNATAASSVVAQIGNSNGDGFIFTPWHPLNPDAELIASVWSMSTYASSLPNPMGSFRMEVCSGTTYPSAGGTPVTTGSIVNKTGSALGTISRNDLSVPRASLATRDAVYLTAPYSTTSGYGPIGPNCILYNGVFAAQRAYGFIPAMGISQGSHRLNEMLFDLRRYHAATGTVQFDLGMITRFKVYIDAAAAAVGGNTRAGFVGVYAGGHNDASAGNFNALVMPDIPWTIYQTFYTPGFASLDPSIPVSNTTGLNASGGTLRIGNEFITYTGFTTNTSINGITRACFGTQEEDHSSGGDIYLGYPLYHPRGFLTDMLWYFLHLKSLWVTAGGDPDYFWFVWPRPIPTSASPTVVDDFTGTSTNAQKEYKLRRYWTEFVNLLQNRYDGLVGINTADEGIWDPSEAEDEDYSDDTDPIHHKRIAYTVTVGKAIRREAGTIGFNGDAAGLTLGANARGRNGR